METHGQSAYALLEKLNCVRVAGTDAEHRAADTLVDTLRGMGLAPRKEAFAIDVCHPRAASLKIVAPFEQEYEVTGYAFCGGTAPEGLRAPFFYAEEPDEISLSNAKGKILLLNSRVNVDQYEQIVKSGAAGFISIHGMPYDDREKTDLDTYGLRIDRHLRNGEVARLPCAVIRAVDALDLLKREASEAVLTVVQEDAKATSHNIIVEIEGTDGGEWLEFGAHYDSVPFSHGMYDNASGSGIILEACAWFLKNRPRRSMRFCWFGAEEMGLRGSAHHVQAHADMLQKTRLMINVDLAGQVIGHHQAVVAADECLCEFLRLFAREKGFSLGVTQDSFSSDSNSYADKGIPAMSFYRGGTNAHTRTDTIALTSPAALGGSIGFLIAFASRLDSFAVFPVPRAIPESVRTKLDTYFYRKPAGKQ